jgi:hypothetical protein
VNEYTKAGMLRGYVLSQMEEVKTKLEEDQTELMAILSSRYISSVKSRCEKWDHNLALINVVIDIWRKVQALW